MYIDRTYTFLARSLSCNFQCFFLLKLPDKLLEKLSVLNCDCFLSYFQQQAAFLQEANELRSGKMSGIQTHKRQVAAVEKSMNTEQQKLDEVSIFVILHYIFFSTCLPCEPEILGK